jgi:DNA repair exonuclease SbcCD nuclease subunit
MKIAVITDLHFGCRGDSLIFLDNQEKFYSEIFFPTIDELGITTVLNLGDTFDRRKYVNYVTLDRARTMFFDQLASRNIDYHAIVGNHDTSYKNTNDINAITLLLREYPNFKMYTSDPVLLTFGSSKIMMVPWLTKENEEASLRYIDKVEADVLAGHFDIVGFEMMRGSICDHGLDRRVFDKFETVWSGHFHHPSKHANIEYLGAPYEMTWTDHNGTRGFHIFDTETRTLTRVHNPYRMFNKITYHDADLTIEEINDLDPSPLKGTYVKIVVAAKTNPYLFELFVNKIQAADPVDVKIVEDNFNLENLSEEEIIDEAMGTREAFFDYIDNVLPDSVGDKEAIKKLMDELYVEALNL